MSQPNDAKNLPKFYWDCEGNLFSLNYDRNSRYGFRAVVTQSFETRDAYALLILWDTQRQYAELKDNLTLTVPFGHIKDTEHSLYQSYGECLAIHVKHASVRDARSQVETWIISTLETLKPMKG